MTTEDLLLKKMYNKIKNHLLKEKKKLVDNSLLLSFSKLKENDRLKIIQQSAVSPDQTDPNAIEKLKFKEYVKNISVFDGNRYTLTAKGIYHFEEENGDIALYKIIDHFDEKLFSFKISHPNDKQKVILTTMLFSRSFDEETALNLKTSLLNLDNWELFVLKIKKFLMEINVIKPLTDEDLLGKKGKNEKRISSFIRHTDGIPNKTSSIYRAPGKQKYYLDLLTDNENGELHNNKFEFLLNIIFGNHFSDNCNEIIDFSEKIVWGSSNFLTKDVFTHFITIEMDDQLKNLYNRYYLKS